ncbi:hypothetical protein [Plesiomonas shigelloides]|nr:hypothetical protein [Plesiomonas shigelloides]
MAQPVLFSKGFALLTSFTENKRFPVLKSRVAKPELDYQDHYRFR